MTPEQQAVLRSVRKLVDFWQIEPHELVSDLPLKAVVPLAPAAPPQPKYRHPITGDVWDGEGSQPAWLKDALTKQGYTVDELRIPAAASGEAAAHEEKGAQR